MGSAGPDRHAADTDRTFFAAQVAAFWMLCPNRARLDALARLIYGTAGWAALASKLFG